MVRPPDGVLIGAVDEHHPCAHDIGERAAEVRDCRFDDLETAGGLRERVGIAGTVGPDRDALG